MSGARVELHYGSQGCDSIRDVLIDHGPVGPRGAAWIAAVFGFTARPGWAGAVRDYASRAAGTDVRAHRDVPS